MTLRLAMTVLAFAMIASATVLGGCAGMPPAHNATAPPTATPVGTATPALLPPPGPQGMISGFVYIEGVPVENAQVEAVSADGTYRRQNTTNVSGAYVLYLPEGVQFNLTGTYSWMHHTLWPAFANGRYDIYMSPTPRTLIAGKGRVVGGPLGYNVSLYNFSTVVIQAVPADGNGTASTVAGGDGSYALAIRPGVLYHLKGAMLTNMWFNYHNTDRGGVSIDVRLDPDETALIDYTVVLPST